MPVQVKDEESIENAKLIFRNFGGREAPFNSEGDRNFTIDLTEMPEKAEELERKGWVIKRKPAREEGEPEQLHLKVKVKFGDYPPMIKVITEHSRSRTNYEADDVPMLDYAKITNADVTLSPYNWTIKGESGVTAYLKRAFITIAEDPIERKYAELWEQEKAAGLHGDDDNPLSTASEQEVA